MEYAQKIILVPEEKFKREQTKIIDNEDNENSEIISSIQTPETVCSRLDEEMSKILNTQNISEYNK